jgi:malate dehydrogenase (oxaloacetate-decarboxylating)(NADP+)
MLFSPRSSMPQVEIQTAARAAKLVLDTSLARVDRPANMEAFIRQHLFTPEYNSPASVGG